MNDHLLQDESVENVRGRLLWVKAAKNVFIADNETEAAGAVFKWVVPYTSCLNMKE